MRTIRSLLYTMVVWLVVYTSANPTSNPSAPATPACPEACQCVTTPEGLHKATCSDLLTLHKYSVRNKHHNINVIDLSDAHIGKVHGELDKFTEVVSIDLSSNSMAHLNKLLRNSKKLVHLNLAKNLLKNFDASHIPSSVSSLDLSHNMLHNAPTNLHSLKELEHLQLNGNPLRCTCNNLKELDILRKQGVMIDDVKCIAPMNVKGFNWAELKISEICTEKKISADPKNVLLEDMMMGDQPLDTENIAPDTTNRKSMPLTALSDLDAGEVWEGSGGDVNDDDKVFLGITTENSKLAIAEDSEIFESSGEYPMESRSGIDLSEKMVLDPNPSTTEEPGSGDFGSGLVIGLRGLFGNESSSTVDSLYDLYDDEGSGDDAVNMSSTTSEPFITGLFNPFFMSGSDSNSSTSEEPFELPESPRVFQGNVDWDAVQPEPSSEKPDTEPVVVEEEIKKVVSHSDESSQKMAVNGASEDLKEGASKEPVKSSVGTYICIGILIALLVGLIGVTIIRGQSRKRRDRQGPIRQQKKDVEKADKEMVDMNKSLLGKPVVSPNEAEKKSNGNNYELVPTHDPRKTSRNGTLDNKGVDENIQRSEAPEPVAQSLSSFKPNGAPTEPISIPRVEEPTGPYEPYHSSVDAPLTNGGTYPNMNLLPPPNEYIPVYDSGRVRIKLTETPKPKTPVLVTRSRSNAGEIIITPSPEQISPSKSTT